MNIEPLGKASREEKEILNIAGEECAEVIQAIHKIFRFGFDSTHPKDLTFTNRMHFTEEVGDLYCMFEILMQKGILSRDEVVQAARQKLLKLNRYSDILTSDIEI